jgi:hypothetical protein
MPRDKAYEDGVAIYKDWMKEQKKLEKLGYHGADYYVKKVEELEAKVKMLEGKLKRKGKK